MIPSDNKWEFIPEKMSWAHDSVANGGLGIVDLWNNYQITHQNVKVAVLDSGIDTQNADVYDAIENKEYDVKCFIPGVNVIQDDIGHGTSCASIIASLGNQMFGVSPGCKLIVGKIESRQYGKDSTIILNALEWACDERNADIISLSFSTPSPIGPPTSSIDKKIANYINDRHFNKNKLFVAAIGNLGIKAKNFFAYPANYSGCISIGAFDRANKIWAGSSWNKYLTFVAPGVGLKGYKLSPTPIILDPATSYSCPFAAGILVNLISYIKNNNLSISAPQIIDKLAFDIPQGYDPLQYGEGFINIVQSFKNLIR